MLFLGRYIAAEEACLHKAVDSQHSSSSHGGKGTDESVFLWFGSHLGCYDEQDWLSIIVRLNKMAHAMLKFACVDD